MSKNIYSIHEFNSEWQNWIVQSNREAWSVELTNLSENYVGRDFSYQSITPIVRLNWGYDAGTIPSPEQYQEFARRCAEFVKNSKGITRVHIGNEPNITKQWDAPPSGPITFNQYVECYKIVFDKIKSVNPNVKIAPSPLATWAIAPEFGWNDWVDDTKRLLTTLSHKVDFIALHAYATSTELDNFQKIIPMNPPFQHRTYSFAVLWEFMNAIPSDLRDCEVHVTETNMNTEWSKNNTGRWVQTLYHEINEWNKVATNQKILSAALFRWAEHDKKWDFSKDSRTKDDFKASLQWNYQHNFTSNSTQTRRAIVTATAGLNLRETPNGKIIKVLPFETIVLINQIENDWANVNVENCKCSGWLSTTYLKEI